MYSPSRSPLPPPSPPDSSGSSQCSRPGHLSHASHLGSLLESFELFWAINTILFDMTVFNPHLHRVDGVSRWDLKTIQSLSSLMPHAPSPPIPHRNLGYQHIPKLIWHKGNIFGSFRLLISSENCSKHIKFERRKRREGSSIKGRRVLRALDCQKKRERKAVVENKLAPNRVNGSKHSHVLGPQHFRRQREPAPAPGHDVYLRNAHFFLFLHWVSFSGEIRWSHKCILRMLRPFVGLTLTGRGDLKHPFCCLRRDSGTLSSYMKKKLWVSSFPFSGTVFSHRHPQILLQSR